MIGPPSLLETAEDDSDPDSRGWNVVDRATWKRISGLVGLPETCRLELVRLIDWERANNQRRKNHPPAQPTRSRQELNRLAGLAGKLSKGLQEMDEGASSAVYSSLQEESANMGSFDVGSTTGSPKFRDVLDFHDSRPIDGLVAEAERLQKTLRRALEIAGAWRGRAGGDPALRAFVERLDDFLIRHTGDGLARTSQRKAKASSSRWAASLDFVAEVTKLAYADVALKSATIDDAAKDAIASRARRPVGRM